MSCIIDKYFKRNQDYRIQDLAHFAGTSPQNIYKILNSESNPNIYIALKITNFFNLIDEKVLWDPQDLWIIDKENININDSS